MIYRLFIFLFITLFAIPNLVFAGSKKTYNPKSKVCGYLEKPCPEKSDFIAENDIPFIINSKVDENNLYKYQYSEPFYIVILESRPIKRIENEESPYICKGMFLRKDLNNAQKFFPKHRVFASSHFCGSRVLYTNTDYKNRFFLAVFGGKTKSEADEVLKSAKENKKWTSAYVQKTQAGHHFGCLH